MKTIINKLRYTLLLSFFALAALGTSLNAAEILLTSWEYPSAFPSTWTVPSTGSGSVGGYYFGGSSGATITIPSSDLQGNTTVIVKLTAAKENGNPHSVTVNGTASNPDLTTSLVELTWANVNASSGITIHVSDWYVNISAIKIYAINDPLITATPNTISFETNPGLTSNKTVTVNGTNLTGDIFAALNDANGVFSVSPASLGSSGGDLTVTYSPTAVGTHTATITLTSAGAEPVTITLNGLCETSATICDGTNTNGYLPVYGLWFDATTGQHNQMLYPVGELQDKGLEGNKITKITFYPENGINFYKSGNEGGTVTIKLANMPSNTTGYASSGNGDGKVPEGGFVTVKTITMPTNQQSNLTEWVFENLEDEFIYEGGDLLIDVTTTIGGYGSTNFYGKNQSSYTGYISYNTTNTGQQFLPKVKFNFENTTPVTDGTVTPDAVDFGNVVVGETATQTVTIKNTGNQPFTPVIDVTGLPEGITVSPTTSGELAGHGTLDLTVTFTPTAEGEYSGSFTVTIPIPDGEDLEFTVNVTGSAYVVSNKLTSNMVEIPVYKSDVNPNAPNGYPYIFSQTDVQDDIDMGLSYDDASDGVSILVKSDEQITGYDLKHKPANGNTWSTAGTATHQGNSYVAGETTMSFGQDETEMWFPMDDQQNEVYDYVPVTVANSIVAGGTQGNTYGAPIRTKNVDNVTLEVIVGGSKSDQRPYGSWVTDGVDYCVYTPVIMISSEALNGDTHIPYMFRAWLLSDDVIYDFERNTTNGHIVGTDPIDLPHCLGTFEVDQTAIGQTTFTIGRDWVEPEGEDNPNDWNTKLENAFGAPSENADIRIVVRAYYTRATRDGDGYAFSEGEGDGDGISTWVMELNSDRQVVGVTYVNPMGMTSDRPFEGMNIIVTRYSDGSCRTSKVMF